MFEKVKMLGVAVALMLSPLAVSAATITGQIDIVGFINSGNSDFSATGGVDLMDPGQVLGATGDFGTFASNGDAVALTDIDFTAPGQIWEVGGFIFTATAFTAIVDGLIDGFAANGIVTGNGFDATAGQILFTTQPDIGQANVSFSSTTIVPLPAAGFLMLGALGGLGLARRRKKAS